MTVSMIMDSRGHRLWPAHQDQVEFGIAFMDKVSSVFVLVPFGIFLEVSRVKLVPS